MKVAAGMDAAIASPSAVKGTKAATGKTVYTNDQVQKGDIVLLNGNTEEKEYHVTGKLVSEAVEKLNKMLEESNRRFEYSVHEKTNRVIIRVIDEATNEVVREIPPEKILDIMASIMELAGLIVDERR